VLCPEKYSAVQRSQHLAQAELRIFDQSYVANFSLVNGQAAFLGENSDHHHIEYFQGLERFQEQGLPCELPVDRRESLQQDLDARGPELEAQSLKALHSGISKDRLGLSHVGMIRDVAPMPLIFPVFDYGLPIVRILFCISLISGPLVPRGVSE